MEQRHAVHHIILDLAGGAVKDQVSPVKVHPQLVFADLRPGRRHAGYSAKGRRGGQSKLFKAQFLLTAQIAHQQHIVTTAALRQLKIESQLSHFQRVQGQIRLSADHRDTVTEQFPPNLDLQRGKTQHALEQIAVFVHRRCPHWAVCIFHLISPGMGGSIREEQTVGAKITVVFVFTVIAAVGVMHRAVRMVSRMVAELPNTAAQHIVASVKVLHIRFQIPGAHTHGMGVLAQEVRRFIILWQRPLALSNHMHPIMPWVHLADHIIAPSGGAHHSFIMHRNSCALF